MKVFSAMIMQTFRWLIELIVSIENGFVLIFVLQNTHRLTVDLQTCDKLESDDFEKYFLYIGYSNDNSSAKVNFYILGDVSLNITLKELDDEFLSIYFEIGKYLFMLHITAKAFDMFVDSFIVLGGKNNTDNALMFHPFSTALDSLQTNGSVLQADVPNKVELDFPKRKIFQVFSDFLNSVDC